MFWFNDFVLFVECLYDDIVFLSLWIYVCVVGFLGVVRKSKVLYMMCDVFVCLVCGLVWMDVECWIGNLLFDDDVKVVLGDVIMNCREWLNFLVKLCMFY